MKKTFLMTKTQQERVRKIKRNAEGVNRPGYKKVLKDTSTMLDNNDSVVELTIWGYSSSLIRFKNNVTVEVFNDYLREIPDIGEDAKQAKVNKHLGGMKSTKTEGLLCRKA